MTRRALLPFLLSVALAAMALGDVSSPAISVRLSPEGEVTGVTFGGAKTTVGVHARTALAGCHTEGEASRRALPGGGEGFAQTLVNDSGARCTLVQRFTPTPTSVRWEIEIRGEGAPWSTAIQTRLTWPDAAGAKFWTAWGVPRPKAYHGWTDPLVAMPFDDQSFRYGGVDFRRPDSISVPIATIVDPARGLGLSLVLSPEDLILDMTLTTTRAGEVLFSRSHHRLSADRPVRFAMDLVPHAPDWRPGLGWMASRYPAYFDPPNPRVDEISGLGAYSAWEGPLDARKLLHMGFAMNWKASFDFPYMGMFLPPVADATQWQRFGGGKTSIRAMAEYSRRMRAMGFQVLNYFNITEFGAGIKYPPSPRKAAATADLWRDANDFLYHAIPGAILYSPQGRPYMTWGNAVAMDPGDPAYQRFLLQQARRDIEKLPASAGICIDRMDWLRLDDPRADDGVSWVDGKPARSLVVSWEETLGKLGPRMHAADKVIFGNPLYRRMDLLRHLDGAYDEMGGMPESLNLVAVMCPRKPVMEWTNLDDLRPDPDAVFQRWLYLGVFPTAPLPHNDHTINPDAWAERYYLDYGPMLQTLRGRKWVLTARPIEVAGAAAKANLFEVPGGYVAPIVLGGKTKRVEVTLRGVRSLPGQDGWRVEVLHPGGGLHVLSAKAAGGALRLTVPLDRGCAVVRLLRTWMTPAERDFVSTATVRLGTTLRGADLRYTLDNTQPYAGSPKYIAPIVLRSTTTVRAAAFRGGEQTGRALMTEYVKVPPSAPAFSPTHVVFEKAAKVTLSLPVDAGDVIRYTIDGSEPTAQSPRYVRPLTISRTTTIRARVFDPSGARSAISSATYYKVPPPAPPPEVPISSLKPIVATVGWGGAAKFNRSIQNKPLSLCGKVYATGMGVSAISDLVYDLRPEYTTFVAAVGLDDEMDWYALGSVDFEVYADGKLLAKTPILRQGDRWFFDVPLPAGAKRLRLHCGDGGDNINGDHGDWCGAGFLTK